MPKGVLHVLFSHVHVKIGPGLVRPWREMRCYISGELEIDENCPRRM